MEDVEKNTYETIDSKCLAKSGDVRLATFSTRNHEQHSTELGYVNQIMAVEPYHEGDYEFPKRTDDPRRRARINEIYEGGDGETHSDGQQTANVKIFEAIRDIDFSPSSDKKNSKWCCNYTCFALLFLSLLSAVSFGTSAYMFYKYEVRQLPMCRKCELPTHRGKFCLNFFIALGGGECFRKMLYLRNGAGVRLCMRKGKGRII